MRDYSDPPMGARRAMALMLRAPRRGRGFWFGLAIDLIWPLLAVFTRLRFLDRGKVPRAGGVILVSNHLSFADPVTLTAFALASGRVPRYLAKADLWRVPVVRRVLAGGGHIPVERNTARARDAYRGAVEAVRRGECVVFFPEAGFSDDAGLWPSARVKNGAARVAMETGAPVVPVVNWGTHEVLPDGARLPRLLPRRAVTLAAGDPVDLSDLAGTDRESLAEATKRIMHALTEQLAELRGERPPGRE